MAKCSAEQMKADLESKLEAQKAANKAKINEEIEIPKEPTIMKIFRKTLDYQPSAKPISQEDWDALFGPKEQRLKKAIEISEIMSENEQLADYMLEYIENDISRSTIKLKDDAYKFDKVTGKKIPILENFPISKLNVYYKELSAWANAEGSKFNSFRFKHFDLSLVPPVYMQKNENTGSYAKMYKATVDHADRIATKIAKYLTPVDDIYTRAGEIWTGMPAKVKDAWKDQFNLSDAEAQEWLHSVLNRMAEGQIVYIDEQEAAKKNRFNDGAGLYIFTQNAPGKHKFEDTGDVMFFWQKPVKFDGYNIDIHGEPGNMKLIDHLNRERHDLLEFIQMSLPLDGSGVQELIKLKDEFRVVNNAVAERVQKEQAEEFAALTETLKKFFPKLSLKDVKTLFLDEDTSVFDKLDSKTKAKYKKEYDFLEANFTQYALSEPFMREGAVFGYKEDHFPSMFHTGEYPLLLKEAIASSKAALELEQSNLAGASSSDKIVIRSKISGLKKSIFNMEKTLKTVLDLPNDMEIEGGMVTRRESKYGKHISNAFDKLKMRTDNQVYHDYLKGIWTPVANNSLTRELLESFLMTDYQSVRDANVSLYKTTIGMPDARGTLPVIGSQFSNDDLPDWARIMFRSTRDYFMTKIAGPSTAIVNQFGHIQKVSEVGLAKTVGSWDTRYAYLKSDKIRPKYKKFILDAGITQFEDFFTHSLVQDLEQVEMKRDDSIQVSKAILAYYNNIANRGISKAGARKILNDELITLFGRGLVPGGLLSKEEAKGLKSQEQQRKIKSMTSKIVNYAISKEYTMRRTLEKAPRNIRNLLGAKKVTFKTFEVLAKWYKKQLGSLVMSETEALLRETSAIIGIEGAQSKGLIRDKDGNVIDTPFYDLPVGSQERADAINYARRMTRLNLDFGMSKNDVGEMHRTVLGSLLGQFAVWKQQKQFKDVNLYKAAWASVKDSRSVPAATKEFIRQLASFRKYSQEDLRTLNPDMANLRAFLGTQGILTMAMDFFFGYTALFNNPVMRHISYKAGLQKFGGGTSDVQSWINLGFILAARVATDNWWEDEEDLEQQIGYYARRTPLGLGFGLGVDLASMLIFYHNEKIREKKSVSNILMPNL